VFIKALGVPFGYSVTVQPPSPSTLKKPSHRAYGETFMNLLCGLFWGKGDYLAKHC